MDNLTARLDLNHSSQVLEGGSATASQDQDEFSTFFELVVPGVLLNIVGILGLIGNLLSIFILSRPQMKGSTNCILIGLASYDSILILTSILMFGLPALAIQAKEGFFNFYAMKVFPYVTPFVYPIGLIAQSTSVYLTLCVTIERYVAVCSPLRARSICTYGRARMSVLCVGISAFLYNIPRFFEVTWTSMYDETSQQNKTIVQPTMLRQDTTYISVYITWMYLVAMYIVPFVSLAVLNLRIYVQIRHSTAERAKLTRHEQREIGMATMLLCVVIVFFVCNILALVVNVLEVMSIAITALTQVSNLMVTLNSSVNFIIYVIYGEKFKRIFLFIFCNGHKGNQKMLCRYTTSTIHGRTPAKIEDSPNDVTVANGHHHRHHFHRKREEWSRALNKDLSSFDWDSSVADANMPLRQMGPSAAAVEETAAIIVEDVSSRQTSTSKKRSGETDQNSYISCSSSSPELSCLAKKSHSLLASNKSSGSKKHHHHHHHHHHKRRHHLCPNQKANESSMPASTPKSTLVTRIDARLWDNEFSAEEKGLKDRKEDPDAIICGTQV